MPEYKTHNVFNFFMTVITCGFWAPIWIIDNARVERKNRKLREEMRAAMWTGR